MRAVKAQTPIKPLQLHVRIAMARLSKRAARALIMGAGIILLLILPWASAASDESATAATNGPAAFATEYKLTGWNLQDRSVYLVRHEPNNQRRYIHLREGEKFQGLQILKINSELKTVQVQYNGFKGDMNFKSHGIRPLTTVDEQGKEFVQVHHKFVSDHVRAHEERYRSQKTSSTASNSPAAKNP